MTTQYFALASGPFLQDWSNTALITADNDWSGVTSITGYRGDNITSATGVDPRTLTADVPSTATDNPVNVLANLSNVGLTSGAVGEFDGIANPVVALQGSGTADAPNLVIYLDATGRQDIVFNSTLRDIDTTSDNTNQQVAVQYRVSETGNWTNLAYVADASAGPSLTQDTALSVALPSDANGADHLQIRVLTTNAPASDEWIGVDDIKVTSNVGSTGTASVSVSGGGAVAEGDSGVTPVTFTVTRTDTSGAFTVDYASADGTATAADGDYTPVAGTLTFAAGGPASQTVTIDVNGDTKVEGNEGFSLGLSNLQNGSGSATLATATASATIINDDTAVVTIPQIQGAGAKSPFEGSTVTTQGVVTAIDTNGSRGFYLQDAKGDGDTTTSDAVFVFTNAAPAVQVGQLVQVQGLVSEYDGGSKGNLTLTELNSPQIKVLDGGSTDHTVADTVIGAGGRLPPTESIADAIKFYESLEGMKVTVKDAQAIDSTYYATATSGPSTWVVADKGAEATGLNSRGGLTISESDFNPERIQVYGDTGVNDAFQSTTFSLGDHLGDVTGVVSYFKGEYELIATSISNTTSQSALPREATTLKGDAGHLTFGEYNVENLGPSDARIPQLGVDIAQNLGSPDVVALEEIQDADGEGSGSDLSGGPTLQALIAAIAAAGGPTYTYVEVAPSTANTTGGAPNGNIRNAFLYNAARVSYVDGSAMLVADTDATNGDAFHNSRMPLSAQFTFNGQTVTAIAVHDYARSGSDELFGANQPPVNSGDQIRIDQTAALLKYVQGLEAADANAKIVVGGDFNAFQFEQSLTQLSTGGALSNLDTLIPATDRYSTEFEGDSEQIDHILVSAPLVSGAGFDIVHLNTGQPAGAGASDHDPTVASVAIAAPVVGIQLTGGPDSVDYHTRTSPVTVSGLGGADRIVGTNYADSISGGADNDSLVGGRGDDTLAGGQGSDRLQGGAGDDTFLFAKGDLPTAPGKWDQIIDFHASAAGGEHDGLRFTGFGAGAQLVFDRTYGSDLHNQLYKVVDAGGVFQGEVLVQLTGSTAHLTSADYVFAS